MYVSLSKWSAKSRNWDLCDTTLSRTTILSMLRPSVPMSLVRMLSSRSGLGKLSGRDMISTRRGKGLDSRDCEQAVNDLLPDLLFAMSKAPLWSMLQDDKCSSNRLSLELRSAPSAMAPSVPGKKGGC